jgi:hypothetical protein
LKLKVDTTNVNLLDPRNLPHWRPDYFEKWPELPEQRPSKEGTHDQPPGTSGDNRAKPSSDHEPDSVPGST